MKLLLVHPSPLMYTKIYLRLEPLGLALVAAAARRAGHTVTLIDLQVESHKQFMRLVHELRPNAIGFSCNYLANVPEVVDLAKLAKRQLPHTVVFVGGHSPRSSPALSLIMATVRSTVCLRARAQSAHCWRRSNGIPTPLRKSPAPSRMTAWVRRRG